MTVNFSKDWKLAEPGWRPTVFDRDRMVLVSRFDMTRTTGRGEFRALGRPWIRSA